MSSGVFYLVLDLPGDFDFDAVDARLFSAGIEGFALTAGHPAVCWECSEPPLMRAINGAIQQVEAAGFSVARVESEDSFTLYCINERLEKQRQLAPHEE
ncbi:MAG: hypothetical protein KY475_05775 [Planctomycetes bacterium]|nr:hypothetical protein [Planctomycetota bacterium]